MGIQNLVLSVEQMKHLGKLGLKIKDTAFVWNINRYTKNVKLSSTYINNQCSVRTLTLQEILELLPPMLFINKEIYYLKYDFCVKVLHYSTKDDSKCLKVFDYSSKKDAAYHALCYLLENGYLNTNNE